jgi:hypothetical protein
MNRTLDMAWLSWFIIGMVWIFGVGAKDCVRLSHNPRRWRRGHAGKGRP